MKPLHKPTLLLFFAAAFTVTAAMLALGEQLPIRQTATAAPIAITFAGAGSAVTLSWNALTGATSYRVLRSSGATTASTDLTSPIVTTSFADRSLTPGQTYYDHVVAVFPDGRQSPSGPAAYTAPKPAQLSPTAPIQTALSPIAANSNAPLTLQPLDRPVNYRLAPTSSFTAVQTA